MNALHFIHRSLYRFWDKVATPKRKTIIWALCYAMLGLIGLYSLFNQPRSLEYAVGPVAMYMLCSFLVFAAIIGVPSSLFGEFKLERLAAASVFLATLLYVIIVVTLHIVDYPGNRLLQAGCVMFGTLMSVERFFYLMERPIAPKQETLLGYNSYQ